MDRIAEIKARISIRDMLAHYGYVPNRAGFISCPFHNEKTASCKVYDRDGKIHCFGCGADADVLGLVQGINKCGLPEAIKYIDTAFGMGLCHELTAEQRKDLRERSKARREAQERSKREKQRIREISDRLIAVLRMCEYVIARGHKWFAARTITGGEIDATVFAAKKAREVDWKYSLLNGLSHSDDEFDLYGLSGEELLKKYNAEGTTEMTREEIYTLAKGAKKRDYRIYSALKMLLGERLDSREYCEFIAKLTDILQV